MGSQVFRYPDGRLPNALAFLYAGGGYVLGIAGLTATAWWLNALATVLLAHALVIAAYLIHECAHNTLFADNRWNARLGAALMWLTGASYGRYEDIRHKHFRHHVDRADVARERAVHRTAAPPDRVAAHIVLDHRHSLGS